MNALKYIRKNPKKSIFGVVVCGFAGRYFKGLFEDKEFRYALCRDVMSEGISSVNWQYSPKSITVFLNPAANNGKSTKLFEKNAAPIFHLSGCDVKVVRLEYEGQAKQFMSVLESTDIVVVAGGNGTVNEVITGLMRRSDAQNWTNVPIGIIPLGETNRIYHQLCSTQKDISSSQQIMNATNNILKGHSKPVDVMKITGENEKSVYALTDFRWGSYSEAFGRTSKFWFWGPLKKYMTFVFASMKSKIQSPRKFQLEYFQPEPYVSCSVDKEVVKPLHSSHDPVTLKFKQIFFWVWNSFGKSSDQKQEAVDNVKPEKSLLDIEFENSATFETLEVTASVNNFMNNEKKFANAACISVEKNEFASIDFIKNGVNRFSEPIPQPINVDTEVYSSQFRITPQVATQSYFKIDNEDFEAIPCVVSVLPNQVSLISSKNEANN